PTAEKSRRIRCGSVPTPSLWSLAPTIYPPRCHALRRELRCTLPRMAVRRHARPDFPLAARHRERGFGAIAAHGTHTATRQKLSHRVGDCRKTDGHPPPF